MSADELLDRLDDLAKELTVRDSPERRAWNMLEPTQDKWTARIYDDGAIALWNDVLRSTPDDLNAVHHLAIMYHARAIDLEQSEHPAESNPDWYRALEHWQRLYETDAFWDSLSDRIKADPDPVPEVREDLAELLLRMHFDIAADERSPHHRARFHVRLALDSGFRPDLVKEARSQAYRRAIGDLDAAVWQPGTIEPGMLRPAIETIIRYLERDDDWDPALRDLLGLLNKLAVAWIQRVNAMTDADERTRALAELLAAIRRYDGYVTRLESRLLSAAEPDLPALSALALWCSRAGQASQVADVFEESAGYYERAREAARAAGNPREREFREEWLMSTVLAARECAKDDEAGARRLLAGISGTERVPGLALLIRAQAWLLLGDLDRADRDARKAPDRPRGNGPAIGDEEFRAECEELREIIQRKRLTSKIDPLMERAERAAAAEDWEEAVRTLGTVLSLDGGYVPALVHRAECYMAQYETAAAKRDLDRAERLSGGSGAASTMEVLRQVRASLNRLDKEVTGHGGPAAFRLQQKGIKAFNEGRRDDGIQYLRLARREARPGGGAKLDRELAECLHVAACEQLESAVRGGAVSLLVSGTADRVVAMLTEAARLAPADPAIQRTLSQLEELRRRMGGYGW